MKTNLDKFKANTVDELEGVWFEASEGVRFLTKRFGGMNSPLIKKALAKHYKPYARLIEKGLYPEDAERKIYIKVFVDACLKDWEGVEVEGQVVPFSKEEAIKLLVHLPDLADMLIEYAQDVNSYTEDLGNS